MNRAAAGLMILASAAAAGAAPPPEVFHNAGQGYLARGSDTLQSQLPSCRQYADVGDQTLARACEQRLRLADHFLRSVAAMGPYSPAAWYMCSRTIFQDLEIGARCLIGVTHACHITNGTDVADSGRCLQLVESGAILLNPIARRYDFKGPPP